MALTAASSPVPVAGQQLTVYNAMSFPATFAGQTIAAGQTLSLIYSNGGWQATAGGGNTPTTASNGLTETGSNFALGGALTGATTISGITAANSLSLSSPTAADALLTIASTAGTGGGVLFGNPGHGVERGFPVPGADNNVGLYTTAGNLFLSTGGRATGEFMLTGGKVGIGTTAPSANLDVVGTVRLENMTGTGIRTIVTDATGNLSALTSSGVYFASGTTALFDVGGSTGNTQTNGVNSSVSWSTSGPGTAVVVTFGTAATSANYEVDFTLGGTATTSLTPLFITSKSTTGFTLTVLENTGMVQSVNVDYTVRMR